jgi:hypothetical protein
MYNCGAKRLTFTHVTELCVWVWVWCWQTTDVVRTYSVRKCNFIASTYTHYSYVCIYLARCLPDYDTVQPGRWLRTLRRNLLDLCAMKVYNTICKALRNRQRLGEWNLDHRLSIRYVFFITAFVWNIRETTLESCTHDLRWRPCRSSYTLAIEISRQAE